MRMGAERHFTDMSNYGKVSDSSTPLCVVEQVKIERGYIDLDDPDQKRKYQTDSPASFNPLISSDRTAGRANAKAEHQRALERLNNGTAVHRRACDSRRSVGRPRNNTEMPTRKGQAVLNTLKQSGIYNVASWDKSMNYLNRIIREVKALGYNIKTVKTGMKIMEFRLIKDEL